MHRIETHAGPEAINVRLAGEIDVAAAGELRDSGLGAIKQAEGRPVIVDLAELTFIDSMGLGALVAMNNAAAETETTLILRSVPPRMAAVMRLTALDLVFRTDAGPTAD